MRAKQTPKSRTKSGRTIFGVGSALAGAAVLALSVTPPAAAHGNITHGTVHAAGGLKVRAVPSTHAPAAGGAKSNKATVKIDCQISGAIVSGNKFWYQLLSKKNHQIGWVSAQYVTIHGKDPKPCTPGSSTGITMTKASAAHQGPNLQEPRTDWVKKGKGNEGWCYAVNSSHGPGPDEKWVVGVETGWIPASAVKTTKHLPYCSNIGHS